MQPGQRTGMYQIRLLDAAHKELTNLNKLVRKRIITRLRWLANNLEDVRLEPLTGDLKGLYKLRVGDYRVIYEVLHEELTIIIHLIGHRREIYKKR